MTNSNVSLVCRPWKHFCYKQWKQWRKKTMTTFWSGSSEFDLSNGDNPSYVAPALETCYLDNEAVIGPLYLTDYESKSEEEEKK